jgi:hypothetical protein
MIHRCNLHYARCKYPEATLYAAPLRRVDPGTSSTVERARGSCCSTYPYSRAHGCFQICKRISQGSQASRMAPSFHLPDFESTQRSSLSSSSLPLPFSPPFLSFLSLAHGGPAFCVTADVWILGLVRFLPIPALSLHNGLIAILVSLFADVVPMLIPRIQESLHPKNLPVHFASIPSCE